MVMLENGGAAAQAWKSGVNNDDPFSVIVVDDEGGVSSVFKVFSSDASDGGAAFATTRAFVVAPESGAKDKESATAPASAPVESAAMLILCRRVPS